MEKQNKQLKDEEFLEIAKKSLEDLKNGDYHTS